MRTIAVLVGSIHGNSINQRLARAVEAIARERFRFSYVDIGTLPHYDDALWPHPPQSVSALKQTVAASDAVLFVTPEYNRSIPGVLKNAIDWGSRPWGESSWAGKPAAIMGTSPGAIGTALAQAHLRNILLALDVRLMGQPEVYVQLRPESISEDFAVSEESLSNLLERHITAFEAWIDQVRPPKGQ